MRTFSGSAFDLIALMFIFGIGAALFSPPVPKALGMWFPSSELAKANGIVFTSMGIGAAIAMATSASFMSPNFGGWRGTMVVLGGISLVMAILWIILYRDRPIGATTEKKKQNVLDNFKKVFKVKDIWLIAVFYGLNMLSIFAMITLLPVMFEERGVARPGELVSIMMITAVVFNIVGAALSDKTGRRKAFIFFPVIIFGIAVLGFGTFTGIPLIIALAVAGACMGTIGPVMMTIPVELKEVGPALTATAVGLIFMIGNTGGFVGPVISGKLMDVTGSQWAGIIFMAAVLILSAGCIIPLKETGRKKKQEEESSEQIPVDK
jgi:cyanate permease